MTRLRRHPRVALAGVGVVVALAAVLLITQTGGKDVSQDPPALDHPAPAALLSILDSAPKPPGLRLIDEHAEPGRGDATTHVTRTYHLTGSESACVQLIKAAQGSGWVVEDRLNRPLDPKTCDPATPNPIYVDHGNDVQRQGWLRRGGDDGALIRVEWRRDWLLYGLDESDVSS